MLIVPLQIQKKNHIYKTLFKESCLIILVKIIYIIIIIIMLTTGILIKRRKWYFLFASLKVFISNIVTCHVSMKTTNSWWKLCHISSTQIMSVRISWKCQMPNKRLCIPSMHMIMKQYNMTGWPSSIWLNF
jgi:hypothetical protein